MCGGITGPMVKNKCLTDLSFDVSGLYFIVCFRMWTTNKSAWSLRTTTLVVQSTTDACVCLCPDDNS